MTQMTKALVVSVTTLGVFAVPSAAFANTVTLPCGCTVVDQTSGNAASTPATNNPTGTVGNADNPNRTWEFGEPDNHQSSAVVSFNG